MVLYPQPNVKKNRMTIRYNKYVAFIYSDQNLMGYIANNITIKFFHTWGIDPIHDPKIWPFQS